MVSYTPILKLTQPDFDQVPWDEQINDDLSVLDAAFGRFMVIPNMSGVWQNAIAYVLGQVLVDSVDSSIWQCAIGHTSAASPTTFAQDRTAHPTYWSSQSVPQNYVPVGGGIMTGPLTLSGTPTADNHATTKIYVDGVITRAGGPFLPTGTDGIVHGTVTVDGLELADSHARIYSDDNYTYFVQDVGDWYWRYTRATGQMTYINNTGADLFHITPSGGVQTADVIKSTAWQHAVYPDFTLARSGTQRLVQFGAGNYLKYDEANANLAWVIGNVPALLHTTSDNHFTNLVGPMAGLSAYVVTSDARDKTDIEPSETGLAAIMALQPVTFRRRGKDRTELGFTAQDVGLAIPEAVTQTNVPLPDEDGLSLGLSMDPIVAALVNAVQELQARIAELEQKV